MTGGQPRPVAAALLSVALLAVLAEAARAPTGRPELPPNVIVVITDDQTVASLRGSPTAMPWLETQLQIAGNGWWTFTDAVVSTPSCCPSRATILTGHDAWQTGVVDNTTGARLDTSDTLATHLHAAGYRTALIGKYLNGYPWAEGPFIPPGWDRWLAKTNVTEATTYYDYALVDQTTWRPMGSGAADHVVEVLSREAGAFIRSAALNRPFFLLFSPPAPHRPATPAPLDAGLLVDAPEAGLARWRFEERVALRSVDRALQELTAVLAWRGDLDRTVIAVMSDNGFSYGEHGWVGKQVPWEDSIRVPLAIRVPGSSGGDLDVPVSNADVAPTLLDLVGLDPPVDAAGESLAPMLTATGDGPALDRPLRLGWPGSARVAPWTAVRSGGMKLIRWHDGSFSLYDVLADPAERVDLADDPTWAATRARLRVLLPPSLHGGDAG